MSSKEDAQEFTRLKEEERLRLIMQAKSEVELLTFIKKSIAELEIAAERLENMLYSGREHAG